MSRRVRNWAIALGLGDVLSWALTVHAHLTFHHHRKGPTVMPVGQLLGWSISVLLLIALLVLLYAARVDARYRGSQRDAVRRG
ncbi:MAG TPA: hypothetical protein VFE40_10950 [Jatrophihabitantaceae bacterium]|jgi:hypothetical protein|nr:hypothetical protein [Jatrophihabitantaceae bacterium]